MTPTVSLNQVLDRQLVLHPHEAVALAQKVIAACTSGQDTTPPAGPPSPDSVWLAQDGSVSCRGCAVTPTVSEIGALLERMLPRDRVIPAPGGLRYAIARALLEVDAPPFDSLSQLSTTLARYERGDRTTVVRELYARFSAATTRDVVAHFPDRRLRSPASDELRRRLRDVDREMFERSIAERELQRVVIPLPSPAAAARAVSAPALFASLESSSPSRRRRSRRWAATGVAAVLLSFVAGYAALRWVRVVPAPFPSRPTAANQPTPAVSNTATVTRSPDVESSAPPATVATQPLSRREPVGAVARADAAERRDEATLFAAASPGAALFVQDAADAQPAGGPAAINADLRVMTVADRGARSEHVQPSPDGRQVAFDSDRDGERAVYVANRDGTGVRRISGSGAAAAPIWSPNADRIAFARAETDRPHVWNLWLLSLANGDMRRLTSFRSGQTWSASWFGDGRRIAYTHDDRLAVLDLASEQTQEFVSPIARRALKTPAVSPDGRHVMVHVTGSGAWLLDTADGSTRAAVADATADGFAWSPDGRRVAYYSQRDGTWGIWVMTPP